MKYCTSIIPEIFPGKHYRISEEYSSDEVYNACVEYKLWVENELDIKFKTYTKLESFLINLREERWG